MSSIEPSEKISKAPESPATNPTSPKPAAKRVSKPPPGYKFVKVRKEDGSIVTVKRKLSPEELAASVGSDVKPKESPKEDVVKSSPTSPSLTVSSVPGPPTTKSPTDTAAKSPTNTTAKSSTETAVDAIPRGQSSPEPASKEALEEQTARFREKRRSRFKNSLIRGIGPLVGAALPTIDIGNWHNGDEVIDHEDDPSDDDLYDDDDDDNQGDESVSHGSSGPDGK
jgi:hypothetical protein